VEVALKWKERSLLVTVVPAASLLFILGMALSLFGVSPIAVKFLLNFSSPHLIPMISLDAYISFLMWMMIGFGVFFQLPLIIVVLTKAGVVNPHQLGLYRKHVLVGILVVAAVLTPGPDVFSQLMLSAPSYILFELSLVVARRIYKPGV
jgi:sec-independent protein translocase protein TatC